MIDLSTFIGSALGAVVGVLSAQLGLFIQKRLNEWFDKHLQTCQKCMMDMIKKLT